MTQHDVSEEPVPCKRCGKPVALCVCDAIELVDSRLAVLILQHPQEQDKELGTARLTCVALKKAHLRVGLSWPSLSKALGRPVDPKRWAILYLGSAKPAELAAGREIIALDRKGVVLSGQDKLLAAIDGIVLLDGTWSQAKALWWRNAWMLKLQRLVLGPAKPSRYGKLRREPRREALATLECAALVLSRLEQRPDIETKMTGAFDMLLNRYREQQAKAAG